MSPKNRPRNKNGKKLQVTIIKITDSKEKKSIHRIDVSGSTGPGGAAAPLAPPRLLRLCFSSRKYDKSAMYLR